MSFNSRFQLWLFLSRSFGSSCNPSQILFSYLYSLLVHLSIFFLSLNFVIFLFFLHLRLLPFLGPASFFPVCVWVISIRFEALFLLCFAFIVFCLILTALLGTRPFSSCYCSLSAAAYYFWMYILLFYFGKGVKEKTLWDFFCCVYICLCKWECGCLTSCSLLPLTLAKTPRFIFTRFLAVWLYTFSVLGSLLLSLF